MRRAASLALALAASFPAGPASAAAARRAKTLHAAGTVVSADPAAGRLVLTGPHGARLEFLVTDATRIASGGRPLTLGDIRSGDRVSVHFSDDSGDLVAKTIVVSRQREKPEKPLKPAKPAK